MSLIVTSHNMIRFSAAHDPVWDIIYMLVQSKRHLLSRGLFVCRSKYRLVEVIQLSEPAATTENTLMMIIVRMPAICIMHTQAAMHQEHVKATVPHRYEGRSATIFSCLEILAFHILGGPVVIPEATLSVLQMCVVSYI